MYTWKILEGLVPNCGIEEKNINERLGRMCQIKKLIGSKQIQKLRSSSFQFTGPTLFNSLPKKLRDLKGICVEDFKIYLDNYLMTVPDQPKLPGMTPAAMTSDSVASNSLVHWIPKMTREAGWRRPGT